VNYVMYLYGYCAGTRSNSPALMADAFENRADAISSIAAVAGIAGALLVHPLADPIAAAIVGVVILHNCVVQLRDAISNLIDKGLPHEVAESLREVVLTHEGVAAVDFVRTRQTGPQYWVDIGIQVAGHLGVAQCDAIAAEVRKDLMQRCDQFQHVEIFVTPARVAKVVSAASLVRVGLPVKEAPAE